MASGLGSFAGATGKEFVQIVWRDDGFSNGLNHGNERLLEQVYLTLERFAPEIENHMKEQAPWEDQTGNARNGLAARAYRESKESMGIVLYHQVPYGIWLEVKYSGRYAIVIPSIQEYGPRVIAACRGIMRGI